MDTAQELEKTYHFDMYNRLPVTLVKGRGINVWDSRGRKYLDFLSGIAVNALGHCPPKMVKAITRQSRKLIHTSNIFYTRPQARLARLLSDISGYERAFFCNSGLEANEAAVKLVRKMGSKSGKKGPIIAFSGAFHGRSITSITMGPEKHRHGFEPLPGGFLKLPFNDIQALHQNINEDTTAVFIEAIQGEGGVVPAHPEFMTVLHEICKSNRVPLVFDEIQTGFGRTGEWFGFMHFGIRPDIITIAKALGGGFPIGGVLTTDEISGYFEYGDHGTTFGGNPLACSAAESVVRVIRDDELVEHARIQGAYLFSRLEKIAGKLDVIREVRGKGLMAGVELTIPCRPVVVDMLRKGFIINCTAEKTIRILPPLIVRKKHIGKLVKNLYKVLSNASE